jgi:DNA repair protein RecO (recombination protein O)
MTPYTSPAIIFRMVRYSETSIICDAYTREKGLRSFIASGVRSAKKGGQASLYRPLTLVEITANEGDADKLSRVKEIRLATPYLRISTDIIHSSVALFLIEVARNAIKEREANESLYDFLEDWLLWLDNVSTPHPALPLLFLTELALELGFGPLDNFSEKNPYFNLTEGIFIPEQTTQDTVLDKEESAALATFTRCNKETISNVPLTRALRSQLTDSLLRYYLIHVAGFRPLQSLPVLREVLY